MIAASTVSERDFILGGNLISSQGDKVPFTATKLTSQGLGRWNCSIYRLCPSSRYEVIINVTKRDDVSGTGSEVESTFACRTQLCRLWLYL